MHLLSSIFSALPSPVDLNLIRQVTGELDDKSNESWVDM